MKYVSNQHSSNILNLSCFLGGIVGFLIMILLLLGCIGHQYDCTTDSECYMECLEHDTNCE